MQKSISSSAPGSIMVTGEHAVVYGHPSIVAAIDQRIHVTIEPSPGREVSIRSEIAPDLTVSLDHFEIAGPYRFVLSAIRVFRDQLTSGLNLSIESEIDPTLGLGSSAAVTAALVGGLAAFCSSSKADLSKLHLTALAIVRDLQGRGSGADLAASLYGGILSYQLPEALLSGLPQVEGDGATINALPEVSPLALCYVGYKTPTAEVLARVAETMKGREAQFEELYQRMGEAAQTAIDAFQSRDWPQATSALNQYQSLMQELGVSDKNLEQLIQKALADPSTVAAKISGSGLGDCVLAVGGVPDGFERAHLSKKGLVVDYV